MSEKKGRNRDGPKRVGSTPINLLFARPRRKGYQKMQPRIARLRGRQGVVYCKANFTPLAKLKGEEIPEERALALAEMQHQRLMNTMRNPKKELDKHFWNLLRAARERIESSKSRLEEARRARDTKGYAGIG